MQAAQASNDVPARYDPARLRRPTTPLPRRGCPIGLGANLSVTAAVPATEMTSVAAGAPARAFTTPPTYLHPSLRRLADGSRPPTPEGSLPGFPRGDVPTPIRPITGRRSLPPSLLYPQPHRLALRLTFPRGRATGLPRSADVIIVHGLGPVATPVGRHPRQTSSERLDLPTRLLAQAVQQLALVLCDDASMTVHLH